MKILSRFLICSLAVLLGCRPALPAHGPLGGTTATRFPQLAAGGPVAADTSGALLIGSGGASYVDPSTITAPPTVLSGAWTNVNFGGGTSLTDKGTAAFPTVYLADFTSGGSDTAHCSFVARPGSVGAAYTLTAKIHLLEFPANNSGGGIAVTDGTKVIVLQLIFNSGGVAMQVVQRNSAASFHANAYSAAWNIGQNAPFCLRIQVTGGNRLYTYASDCENFIPAPSFLQETDTTWINNNETMGGICINPEGSTGAAETLESLKFTSP